MTAAEIEVRGTSDPYAIAVVVALLGRHEPTSQAQTGVTAWQRTRRAALRNPHRRPHPGIRRSG